MTNEEARKIIGKMKPNDRIDNTKKLEALFVALNALEAMDRLQAYVNSLGSVVADKQN